MPRPRSTAPLPAWSSLTRSAGPSCSQSSRRALPSWRCASRPPAQHRLDDLALVVTEREEGQSRIALLALRGKLAREALNVLVPALPPLRRVAVRVVRRFLCIAPQAMLARERTGREAVLRHQLLRRVGERQQPRTAAGRGTGMLGLGGPLPSIKRDRQQHAARRNS